MSTIFQVLSNIKHNGDLVTAGTFIEGEAAAFESLVQAGALRIVEGAESIAHAAEIVAAEAAAKLQPENAPAPAPQDTWGPTKEPVTPADTTETAPKTEGDAPAAPAADLAKFNVLKEFEVTNAESKNFGKHAVGEVIEASAAAAQPLVDNGTLAPVDVPTGDNL